MDDKNQLRNTIAKNLANLRKNKKLTQAELAQKFGYSDKAVSKWETGETLPDIEILYSLCTFYDVSLDFLTHEITEENKNQYVTHYNRRIEKPEEGRKVVGYAVCEKNGAVWRGDLFFPSGNEKKKAGGRKARCGSERGNSQHPACSPYHRGSGRGGEG